MSNLPPGVTLADIDAHFGPPRCAVYGCPSVAEEYRCAVCGDPLCDGHAGYGVSSTCRGCEREVDVAMDEFSYLRIEQMLRDRRRYLRLLRVPVTGEPRLLGEVRLLDALVEELVSTRTSGKEHGDDR